ncbi:hypothetical protein HON22_04375 [Candidatus Peregrinibacteria bacterium]|jgi:hypothetical protein|nr:hypothetical protein [Candidatus Peregrinibacteria bacterium]
MKKSEKLKICADLRNRLQCMQFIAENQIDEVRKTIENYPQSLWKEVEKASLLIERIECSDSKDQKKKV